MNFHAWLMIVVGLATALALALYDLRHFVLPDSLNALLGLAGIGFHLSAEPIGPTWPELIFGAGFGGGILYGLRMIYGRLRGIEAIGLGDVKLMISAGFWVGIWATATVLAVASIATLLVILILRGSWALPNAPLNDRHIPFGPGLCAGLVVVWLNEYGWIL